MAETTLAAPPAAGLFPAAVTSFSSDQLNALGALVTAQNANNASLRTSVDDPTRLKYVSVPLSLAELQALYSAPKVLLAAQGSGTLIEFVSGVVEYVKGSSAFTIGSATNLTVSYKSDASGGSTSVNLAVTGVFDQSTTQVRIVKPLTTNVDGSAVLNQPLVLSLAVADMTSGTGSSGTFKMAYRVHSGL